MDEYKKYVYMTDPGRWEGADVGALLRQRALREHLECKSFKWFLDNVAVEVVKLYPPMGYPWFAKGAVRAKFI
jgi:polypeptide N-acetylgalactosaminyltransferase